jgi:hypothetical protein
MAPLSSIFMPGPAAHFCYQQSNLYLSVQRIYVPSFESFAGFQEISANKRERHAAEIKERNAGHRIGRAIAKLMKEAGLTVGGFERFDSG